MTPARITLLFLLVLSAPALGQDLRPRTSGQRVYLPIYSHLWYGEVDARGQPQKSLVSVLVSVRSADSKRALQITSARYYDTNGKTLKEYVEKPRTVGPLATFELFIPRSDDSGGSGANFIITWKSDAPIDPPVIEAVHANLSASRSVAFITSARVLNPD